MILKKPLRELNFQRRSTATASCTALKLEYSF